MIVMGQHKPPLAELRHHGVKGMKWGVRHQAKKNYRALVREQNRRVKEFRKTEWAISEEQYKNMSAKPIPLGKNFHRIAENANLRDFVYATNNENDRNTYKAFFGPGNQRRKINKKSELTLQSKKELVSPGEKVRVDAYVTVLDKALKNDAAVQNYFGGPEAAKALNAREVGFQSFRQFSQSGHMGTSLHTAYFQELQKRGYGAVIDDADRNLFSNTPVILFPKTSGVRVTEIKPVTKEDILKAKLNLKPLERA